MMDHLFVCVFQGDFRGVHVLQISRTDCCWWAGGRQRGLVPPYTSYQGSATLLSLRPPLGDELRSPSSRRDDSPRDCRPA